MREILIIDNDVMINIFEKLKEVSPAQYKTTIQQLSLRYHEIWVPAEVQCEFAENHHLPKVRRARKRLLAKIFDKHQFIVPCPIKVTKRDIDIENGLSDEDKGETDAMLQSIKASANPSSKFKFSQIHLLFRDKGAIKRASAKNLSILHYKTLVEQFKEIGIILPK